VGSNRRTSWMRVTLSADFKPEGEIGIPELPAGSYAVSVVAADVNGDGKPDLISANSGDGTLSLLFNLSPAVTIAGGFTGYFTGNGSGLSDLNPDALAGSIPPGLLTSVPAGSLTGTLPASVIPSPLNLTSFVPIKQRPE